ncbi:hypothetical protein DFH27DRAFT_656926 [Peziza echinospora]|nr:hypothetical protein DFH27DRAFT_656926 [Peziza echinospora]
MSNEASRDSAPPLPSLGAPPPPSSFSAQAPQTPPAASSSRRPRLSPSATARPSGAAPARRSQNANNRRTRRDARLAALTATKLKFITDFIRSMDMVVYFYFSYIYFLDNSFFRFFIRCAIQLNFLTPKPINLPTPPQRRSVVVGLFGWTIVNIACHVLNDAPEAGEASGGWLHGGFLVDFIGQEGPISKYRLVITDLTILLLQLVMLAATLSKQGFLETQARARRRSGVGDATTTTATTANAAMDVAAAAAGLLGTHITPPLQPPPPPPFASSSSSGTQTGATPHRPTLQDVESEERGERNRRRRREQRDAQLASPGDDDISDTDNGTDSSRTRARRMRRRRRRGDGVDGGDIYNDYNDHGDEDDDEEEGGDDITPISSPSRPRTTITSPHTHRPRRRRRSSSSSPHPRQSTSRDRLLDHDHQQHQQQQQQQNQRHHSSSFSSSSASASSSLNTSPRASIPEQPDGGTRRSASHAARGTERSPRHDRDGRYALYSGQLVVAELSIVGAVRRQWMFGLPGAPGPLAGNGDLEGSGSGTPAAVV